MQDKYIIALIALIGLVNIEAQPINETICKGIPPNVTLLLPHPENCSLFIECTNEVPVVIACPEGLHWSTQGRQCDYPEIANCKLTKTNIPSAACEGVPENINVLLANPNNCETYIQCVHQSPVVQQCPQGLHWDTKGNRCDWPEVANCKANTCQGVSETENILLPNPDDCESFIQCVHQEPIVRQCPVGLYWNVATTKCDWPHLAKCSTPATRTKTLATNKWTSCDGVPESSNVLLPNPSDCESYIQCVHQQPIVRPCPPTLHWNANKNVCDWPEAANCKRKLCEGVPETENVLIPNPEDCGSFIQCVHQEPVVRQCPDGLHWSTAINKCDWPYAAHCNTNVNP